VHVDAYVHKWRHRLDSPSDMRGRSADEAISAVIAAVSRCIQRLRIAHVGRCSVDGHKQCTARHEPLAWSDAA
jgi:hypothetical protein